MLLPQLSIAQLLNPGPIRLFMGAYGFEQRSLGWSDYQIHQGSVLSRGFLFKYRHRKGRNLIHELRHNLQLLGISEPNDITYDVPSPHTIETEIEQKIWPILDKIDEIILDISAMTKLLILVTLCKLIEFHGLLRIVDSEANEYPPTNKDYERYKQKMVEVAKFPSRGVEAIIRVKCLSSIRMQGQPVTMIAFASFNEQLVRHMLGTINPHRLIFINGRPPREDFRWREDATQEIHKQLIDQYKSDNPIDKLEKLLERVSSTLYYSETIDCLDDIYNNFGNYERIICAATGSKMQTVGLFFSKIRHPDIHIEYPTPDSYLVKGRPQGVRRIHEIFIPKFSEFL